MSALADAAPSRGRFTWHELMTGDPAAAQTFYGRVFGWRFDPGEVGGRRYDVVLAGDVPVGGLLALDTAVQAGGAGPVWVGYVAVEALDAATGHVRDAGGKVLMDGMAIPGMGRFALVADPEGVPLYLMEYSAAPPPPAASFPPPPGTCAWNELAARDPDAAIAFHTGLNGWRQEGEMPMGELGSYRFLHHDDAMIGAVMPLGATAAQPGWAFYFVVPDIDAAAAAVREGGGAVIEEPVEIPGGSFSIVARDPQGARFGCVGPRLT